MSRDKLISPIFNFPITFTFSLLLAIVAIRGFSRGFAEVTYILIGEKSLPKFIVFLSTLILLVVLEHSHNALKVIHFFLRLILRFSKHYLRKTHNLIALFLVFISINAIVLINLGNNSVFAKQIYSIYRINPIYPQFADLRTTLIAIQCPEVNQIGDYIVCGDRGNNWTYPTVLLMLRVFGVNEKVTNYLMLFVLLSLTSLIYYLMKQTNAVSLLYSLLLLNCPPFLIVIERGNVDLIIFTLLITILFLLNRNSMSAFALIFSAALIALASFLKFYPLFAFAPIIYISIRNIRRLGIAPAAITSFIGMLSLAVLIHDFRALSNYTVNDLSGSVGLRNIYALTFGLENSKEIPLWSFLIFSTLIFLPFTKNIWQVSTFYPQTDIYLRVQLLITSTIATIPLLLTTNYYYRLIFLFPLTYLLSKIFTSQGKEMQNNLIVYIFLPIFLAYLLVFRSFALLQNVILLPVYLLIFCFITHEFREIRHLISMEIR